AEALATGVISNITETIVEETSAAIDTSNREMSGSVSFTFDKTESFDRLRTSAQPDIRSASSRKVVKVPRSYKYCPRTCKPRSLHDYCTWSPDSWRKANFRGPCAIHDMRIDKTRKKRISVQRKRAERRKHDAEFGRNLRTNCSYYYHRKVRDSANRSKCHAVTYVYQAAVSAKTKKWNGK
ncbi:phospholipase, partial [Arthrobacter sp. HMSC06H05]|uniref:phospholipase n=1 Tax=Arthrobacter sp. HMSC06H05 TaxID=1581128 RepID=UPI001C404FCE